MGWILLLILILDWIVMFIELFKAIKYYKTYEINADDILKKKSIKYFKYFFICIAIGFILCIAVLFYSLLHK